MTILRVPFLDVFEDESGGNIKTPQSEYLPVGKYPVVDQGKALIAGYVDDESRLCGDGRPAIVFGDHTRCVKYAGFPFCMGADGVKVLRPKGDADLKYLYYFLRQLDIPNAGYDRHFKYLKRTEVVLQPLPEQRRIAAILDQADALRAKRRVALAQLDSLTQSIFIEMFGDVLSNPKAWPVKRLDEVCNFFAGNSLPDGVPFVGQEGGYFLMKVSDMNLEGNEKSINVCQSWSPVGGARSSTCPVGSIVIPKRGGAIGTNKKRVTTRETVLDPNVMAISPNLSFLLREYLFHWFQCFDLSSISSGSSVPQLNKQDLAPLTIQAPPISLQQDFAKLIQAIETLKANHNDAMQELDRLFASLQHRAFQGEL